MRRRTATVCSWMKQEEICVAGSKQTVMTQTEEGTVRSQNRVIAIILVLRSRMSQRAPSGTTTPSAKQLTVFVE